MSALQGRVFDRFRQFQKLSPSVQEQVNGLTDKVLASNAFANQSVSMFSSVYGAKPAQLVDVVLKELTDAKREDAEKIVDALVLKGAVTLHNEGRATASQIDGFAAGKTILVPTSVKDTTSVWDVREGAIQAGVLKRSTKSMLGVTNKDAYYVANDQRKALYVFDSDVARDATAQLDLAQASVQFDSSVEHGVKVSNSTASEVFAAESKEKAEEWLNSIINAGATYREAFNLDAESVKSFYELKDYDMQGAEVPMSKYKGKVVLVVNVSSLCGLTPTNYPELTKLDEMYRDQGLEILAFPCNQFNSQEPGTHEEIMEFVKQYNCKFPFFEKHDVNGANARPVFTYLKAKLPGSFGNFVKWNFTKFLVDRNGVPYKRYAPKDLPFSFEEDIKTLLAQIPSEL
ncbi:TPA: hypothetical protein N0F65_001684 [Lagenidium giganteum]|uniref:Glutathione peroxidase n=1 Tax=Lagenidium giganteum TaxID=4803 RepID=A0AAV2Z1L6_9STRA|nr:TPA: hypothetical protein N0F65_001684 [Lagenidium giganteum]